MNKLLNIIFFHIIKMKKGYKQRNQIKIIKNKEIIIYKNGKKYKHFKRSETKKLKENEMYLLDYLLNKYMGNEVDSDSQNSENSDNNDNEYEINSNEDSKIKKKKLNQSNEEENEEQEEEKEEIITKNKNIKNKRNSSRLYEEGEEENGKINIVKSKKKKNINQSDEEEENEEEESLNEKISKKKGRKNKYSKRSSDSNEGEFQEEKIIKRIIKHSKDSNNKVPKKSITKYIHGEVVEIKHTNNESKRQTQKAPERLKNKKKENDNSEENEEYEREEKNKNKYKKEEYIPPYIEQLKSYTSPTFKFIDEEKAEKSVLNGIPSSLFVKSQETKGILFFGKNDILCFISSEEDNKETDIVLDNIKKIYFNLKGGDNLKDYYKKPNEKFIQFVEINNKTSDFKFNSEEDYELLIKGLIRIFKNKIPGTDKDLIYYLIRSTINKNISNSKFSFENKRYQNDKREVNHLNLDEVDSNEYNYENNEAKYNIENVEIPYKNEKEDDDVIITTTITEVFKDGELINKETREKMDGVMKSLHVYSPDKEEYEKFLKNTKLGQNQMIKRNIDGLPLGDNNNSENNNDEYSDNINNEKNPFEVEDEKIEQ